MLRTNNGGRRDKGAWGRLPKHVEQAWAGMADEFTELVDKHPKLGKCNKIAWVQRNGALSLGDGQIDDLILVDQSPIGRSARSNPVTYIKAYDPIRDLYLDPTVRSCGLNAMTINPANTAIRKAISQTRAIIGNSRVSFR